MKKAFYLLFLLFSSSALSEAQTIPNNGFENWTNMGSYYNPDQWSTFNDVTTATSTYTCLKGTPGVVGSAYLKLISKSAIGMGIVPAIAVCGTFDIATLQPTSGFPFSGRPAELTGRWQHMGMGSDQGFIAAALTKWNGNTLMRDTVAYVYEPLGAMVMSWANFTIPVNYMNGDYPDSCIIILSASQSNNVPAVANSYLFVDELLFSGTVSGVSELISTKNISVSPNPASDVLILDLSTVNENVASFKIYDVQGRLIKAVEKAVVNSNTSIDISDIPKGNYVLKISSEKGSVSGTFIKQ
jgi:Secretion system C-terminal sorting domain